MSITRIGGSDKPKPREITSIEELTPVVEKALQTAVDHLVDPTSREMEEAYVDIPKAFVKIDVDINIPGISKEEAMEAVLTNILGERDAVQETDATDNIYVVQYIQDAVAIMLSKVLKTDEAITLASGAIAIERKNLADIPGSTLSVVGKKDDRPWTADDVLPTLKRLFLGRDMRYEKELEVFRASENKPPLILLTCRFHSDELNERDQQGLEFLFHAGIGWAFRMREGSTHFFLETGGDDAEFLSGVRRQQHAKIAEVLS
jgi:hypothetical protein